MKGSFCPPVLSVLSNLFVLHGAVLHKGCTGAQNRPEYVCDEKIEVRRVHQVGSPSLDSYPPNARTSLSVCSSKLDSHEVSTASSISSLSTLSVDEGHDRIFKSNDALIPRIE